MRYQILWAQTATRQLGKLDRSVARRIVERVQGLEDAPLRQLRRLAGQPYYRLRVGDYRIIVEVLQGQLQVLVLKVGQRESIYQ